jgi:hypothetical protein
MCCQPLCQTRVWPALKGTRLHMCLRAEGFAGAPRRQLEPSAHAPVHCILLPYHGRNRASACSFLSLPMYTKHATRSYIYIYIYIYIHTHTHTHTYDFYHASCNLLEGSWLGIPLLCQLRSWYICAPPWTNMPPTAWWQCMGSYTNSTVFTLLFHVLHYRLQHVCVTAQYTRMYILQGRCMHRMEVDAWAQLAWIHPVLGISFCMCVRVSFLCTCTHMYIYIYIYVYIHTYIDRYIYTHTFDRLKWTMSRAKDTWPPSCFGKFHVFALMRQRRYSHTKYTAAVINHYESILLFIFIHTLSNLKSFCLSATLQAMGNGLLDVILFDSHGELLCALSAHLHQGSANSRFCKNSFTVTPKLDIQDSANSTILWHPS